MSEISVVACPVLHGMGAMACGCCGEVKKPEVLCAMDLDLRVRVCVTCGMVLQNLGDVLATKPGFRAPYEEERGDLLWRD